MSLDRAATAVALSTVEGVTGYAYRPTTPTTGDAWPLLTGYERDAPTGVFVSVSRVMVLLPQEERDASDWIDTHAAPLIDALQFYDIGYVDRLDPVELANTNQLALQISMRSE